MVSCLTSSYRTFYLSSIERDRFKACLGPYGVGPEIEIPISSLKSFDPRLEGNFFKVGDMVRVRLMNLGGLLASKPAFTSVDYKKGITKLNIMTPNYRPNSISFSKLGDLWERLPSEGRIKIFHRNGKIVVVKVGSKIAILKDSVKKVFYITDINEDEITICDKMDLTGQYDVISISALKKYKRRWTTSDLSNMDRIEFTYDSRSRPISCKLLLSPTEVTIYGNVFQFNISDIGMKNMNLNSLGDAAAQLSSGMIGLKTLHTSGKIRAFLYEKNIIRLPKNLINLDSDNPGLGGSRSNINPSDYSPYNRSAFASNPRPEEFSFNINALESKPSMPLIRPGFNPNPNPRPEGIPFYITNPDFNPISVNMPKPQEISQDRSGITLNPRPEEISLNTNPPEYDPFFTFNSKSSPQKNPQKPTPQNEKSDSEDSFDPDFLSNYMQNKGKSRYEETEPPQNAPVSQATMDAPHNPYACFEDSEEDPATTTPNQPSKYNHTRSRSNVSCSSESVNSSASGSECPSSSDAGHSDLNISCVSAISTSNLNPDYELSNENNRRIHIRDIKTHFNIQDPKFKDLQTVFRHGRLFINETYAYFKAIGVGYLDHLCRGSTDSNILKLFISSLESKSGYYKLSIQSEERRTRLIFMLNQLASERSIDSLNDYYTHVDFMEAYIKELQNITYNSMLKMKVKQELLDSLVENKLEPKDVLKYIGNALGVLIFTHSTQDTSPKPFSFKSYSFVMNLIVSSRYKACLLYYNYLNGEDTKVPTNKDKYKCKKCGLLPHETYFYKISGDTCQRCHFNRENEQGRQTKGNPVEPMHECDGCQDNIPIRQLNNYCSNHHILCKKCVIISNKKQECVICRSQPTGQESRGQEFRGKGTRGQGTRGQGTRGQEPRGQEFRGQGTRGQEPRGQEPRGQEPRGKEPRGQEPKGQEFRGQEFRGQGTRGQKPNNKPSPTRSKHSQKLCMLCKREKATKFLHCKHFFCTKCLQEHINNQIMNSPLSTHIQAGVVSITCPNCGKHMPSKIFYPLILSSTRRTYESIISVLPKEECSKCDRAKPLPHLVDLQCHKFCMQCMIEYFDSKLDRGKINFKCILGCNHDFDVNELKKLMNRDQFLKFKKIEGSGDQVQECPGCDRKCFNVQTYQRFKCNKCNSKFCGECGKAYKIRGIHSGGGHRPGCSFF